MQGIDLSTAFEGSSLADATCLLHMLYGSVAGAGSFFRLSLAGRLQRVAQLAHKLDAAPFLAKLDGYLQGRPAVGGRAAGGGTRRVCPTHALPTP